MTIFTLLKDTISLHKTIIKSVAQEVLDLGILGYLLEKYKYVLYVSYKNFILKKKV